MAAPTTRIEYPTYQSSGPSGARLDYSGEKELRVRRDAVAEAATKRLEALYAGDIPAALAAGRRIRALKRSMSGIDPVKAEPVPGEKVETLKGASITAEAPKAAADPAATQPAGATEDSKPGEQSAPRVKLPGRRRGLKGPQTTDASMTPKDLEHHSGRV